jgi:hypothetical protein
MMRLASMADALQSARDKLARGDSHRAIARREIRRFFNHHPNPTFKIEPEGQLQTVNVGDVLRMAIVVDQGIPDLPASCAARFGDILHNYRSVLDHIAWQLVRHGSSWPLPDESAETAVQFPIYSTAQRFEKGLARRLPGVDPVAIDYIRQRYQFDGGGNPTNDALLGLANLSNDDKHRSLHASVGVFKFLETNAEFTRCVPQMWANPPGRPGLKPGTEVARFEVVVTGSNPKMSMKIAPTVQVVIEGWADMSEMIEGLRKEVREILNAPEIVAAVA